MYAKIKNFITMRWTKKEMEPPPIWRPDLKKRDLNEYNIIQIKLFDQLKDQLKKIYPDSFLHVITNEKNHKNEKNIYYHFYDFESSHILKLNMYGLINEPAMYIDSDIIILNKFKEEDLYTNNNFTYFNKSGNDFKHLSKKPLPCEANILYNAGLVWIPKPSKKITEKMYNIHYEYFEDKNNFLISDENASSLYVFLNNIKIDLNFNMNVPRCFAEMNLKSKQSIHYTGYDNKWKYLCLQEYKKYSCAFDKNIKLC